MFPWFSPLSLHLAHYGSFKIRVFSYTASFAFSMPPKIFELAGQQNSRGKSMVQWDNRKYIYTDDEIFHTEMFFICYSAFFFIFRVILPGCQKWALEMILDVVFRVTGIVGSIFTLMMPGCVGKKWGTPNVPRKMVCFVWVSSVPLRIFPHKTRFTVGVCSNKKKQSKILPPEMVTVTVWKMFKSHDFGPWHTQISCSLFTSFSENLLHHSLLNSISQDSQTSPCVCCFLNLVATEPATKLKATTSEDIVVKLWNISIFFIHTYRRKFRSPTSDNMDSWKSSAARKKINRCGKKEDQQARNVREVAKCCVFQCFVCRLGRKVTSLKRRVRR